VPVDLKPEFALGFTSAANPVLLPKPKPRAMGEHFVVPSIRSRDVARAQRSGVPPASANGWRLVAAFILVCSMTKRKLSSLAVLPAPGEKPSNCHELKPIIYLAFIIFSVVAFQL
jgi:hypothetical protein